MNRSIIWILTLWVGLAHAADTPNTVAASTANVLKPAEAKLLALPQAVAQRIKTPTALFYFSPTCPHCQDVMPEINALVGDSEHSWLGVASSRSTGLEIKRFETEYAPRFEILHDDLNANFANAVSARSTPSVYIVRPRAAPEADDPPGAVDLLDAYTPFARGTAGLFRLRSKLSDPFHGFDGYQGPQVCGSCHQVEIKSWVITHHAASYRTLYTRDRATDLECVGCHVTGMDQPGGFKAGDHGSPMRDVSCEACHGAGGPHNPSRTEAVDARAICVSCHDDEHSIAFSVEKGLPHINHFSAKSLTDSELRDRIMAISSGEAERPLLAFPEGPSVGAEACKACHKSEHKNWSKSPHGEAMARLKGEEVNQTDCVRCHATPKQFGTTSTEHGFRVDESVGCESCHGAGGAHIAAPSKANIVGLGEQCPECVIETVCTRCHTPKWDPGWVLKDRLEATKH